MSGWLVMWGPLIIVGFLILVFMGEDQQPPRVVAAPAAPAPVVAAPDTTPVEPALVESGLEVSPEKAAADLAEAFRAAGIPLPGEVSEPAPAAVPPAPQLPPEMQANPWAPAPGQPQGAPMAPPPPGYGQYPYQGGYPPPGYAYGGPPPGYGYGAPGYGGYGGYPPPMGGRGMGYGGGYPMHAPGMQPQGRMPHQGAPPGYGGQRFAPPPPQGARGGGASGAGAGQTN